MADAMALIDDPRVQSFWDQDRKVGELFRAFHLDGKTVRIGQAAWDTYLLFGRDARWRPGSSPPEPTWWEHQLWGLPDTRLLDAERFAAKAAELARGG